MLKSAVWNNSCPLNAGDYYVELEQDNDRPSGNSEMGREGKLEPISWDEFFKKFDEQQLVFTYQDVTAEGQKSNFNKLISRHTAEDREEAAHKTASHRTRSAGGKH